MKLFVDGTPGTREIVRVYAHGALEDMLGFDILSIAKNDSMPTDAGAHACTVHGHKAVAYVHHRKHDGARAALVVLATDKEAIQDGMRACQGGR